jgi:hypothetical protein
MDEETKNALANARAEWRFWREFAESTTRRFATSEIARIVALQEFAERKLVELERAIAMHEAESGKGIDRVAVRANDAEGPARE